MDVLDVCKEEYKKLVIEPFSRFDTVEFIELNKYKVDEIKYFIFNNGKNRFSLVAGIKDNILKCPFSASFGIMSEISHNNRILHYHDAVNSLVTWAKENGITKIIFSTPPLFYSQTHISKMQNALFCNGFKVVNFDLNYQLDLKLLKEYDLFLNSDARRNLKIAYKNDLKFEKTKDLSKVYEIIKINRQEKGFPLWMSESDVSKTSKIIKSDYFLVSYDNKYIASAYIQHITNNIVNVVYWGNLQKFDKYYPMNFIAENVYNYYKNLKKVCFLSIGTSTLDSVPNFGLCDFKESIGCEVSPKLTFELALEDTVND